MSLTGTLRQRLTTGLIAQGYSQLITIGVQLVPVPVLLWSWGAEHYGVWLVISAVPTFLSLADFGFAQAGASDMTMRIAAGEPDKAKISYDTVFALNCLFGAIAFAAMAGVAFSPLSIELLGAAHADADTRLALLALAGHALFSLLIGVINAGLRSVGHFATAVGLYATMRLVEASALVAVAATGGGLLDAALAMFACRVLAALLIVWRVQHRWRWLRPGLAHASPDAMKRLLAPSLHFAGLTVGNLVSIQGSTIVIGAALGPAAVALASTARTLARVGVTAATMLNSTLQPEYSAHFGRAQKEEFRRLFAYHIRAVAAVMVLYVTGMLTLGPQLYRMWTHGAVVLPPMLFVLLVLGSAGDMLWTALQTPALAANRMRLTGTTYLVASVAGLAVLAIWADDFGVMVFGWVGLTTPFIMLAAALRERHNMWRALG